MQLRKSVNTNSTRLPKLLGQKESTPKQEKEKIILRQSTQVNIKNKAIKEAKILQNLANDYITEKTIKSTQDGDNKVIFRTNIQTKELRDK